MNDINLRLTPSGDVEDAFRRKLRDVLDLDLFTRDDQILDEIRKLKREQQERRDASISV